MSEPTKMCICATEQNQDADCAIHGEWYGQRDAHNARLAATPLPAPDHGAAQEWAEFLLKHPSERNANLARAYFAKCEEVEAWVNREASVCPEDVGFVEYIKTLERRALAPHGEAVAWVPMDSAGEKYFNCVRSTEEAARKAMAKSGSYDGFEFVVIPLFTHPAPVARVTSEMVEAGYKAWDDGVPWRSAREQVHAILTAALSEATNA